MKLKHIDSNNEIVLTMNQNHVKLFFGKLVKIEFINISYKLSFEEDI